MKTIEATAMKDYLPLLKYGKTTHVLKYRSNCNERLSPLHKYGKTTHVLKYRSNCNERSPLLEYGKTTHVLNIEATAIKDYLPCINMGRQLMF